MVWLRRDLAYDALDADPTEDIDNAKKLHSVVDRSKLALPVNGVME